MQLLAEATLAKVAQQRSAVFHPLSPVATVQAALPDGSCATANEAVVVAIKSLCPQWKSRKQKADAKPPSSAKCCLKCRTSHWPGNSCFVDTKDLVCAECGKHGHACRTCMLVHSVTIATPATPSKYVYLADDFSSDDDFHHNLEVHPKVMPHL